MSEWRPSQPASAPRRIHQVSCPTLGQTSRKEGERERGRGRRHPSANLGRKKQACCVVAVRGEGRSLPTVKVELRCSLPPSLSSLDPLHLLLSFSLSLSLSLSLPSLSSICAFFQCSSEAASRRRRGSQTKGNLVWSRLSPQSGRAAGRQTNRFGKMWPPLLMRPSSNNDT